MVETVVNPDLRNVVDLASYRAEPIGPRAAAGEGRRCRHCGAALLDDESEDDCSSAGIALQSPARWRSPRRFRAD
ncbi:hypothetical protein DU475_05385 [Rhodopseudomonas sp. WA056]|jgi:hypothetical protein|uniref:Uncharacterized protein n=1 Tax=Rhodopseudomonas palustris (strain DX-1) TaxID=652103 RepID=E6VGF3_RHOPX|nr:MULTISPECIES: hypothetical protein [Rhodopseudomonas]NEW86696.1 hypothetical protein [Rhodopseudomonas sp. WA056]QDL96197.1 hypothetical protein FLL57_02275 [Rhodopseudomonas palustris]